MKKLAVLFLSGLIALTGFHHISAKAESTGVRILFTHELLDRIEPCKTLNEENEVVSYGGYAYLSSAISEYRNENTVTVDAGGYSIGSMYGAVNSSCAPSLSLLKQMGYDAIGLSTADLEYGASKYAEMLEAAQDHPALVQANMTIGNTALKNAWDGNAYTIVETADYKVGIFALCDQSEEYGEGADVSFSDVSEAAVNTAEALRKLGADLIICLYSTDRDDFEILSEADIDVIIAGGSHTAMEKAVTAGQSAVVSSDPKGKTLGVLDIDPDTKEILHYENVEISADAFSADTAVNEKISTYRQEVQKNVMTRFGLSTDSAAFGISYSLTTYDRLSSEKKYAQAADLVTDAMIEAYTPLETDEAKPVSITTEDQITGTLLKGNVSANDLFMMAYKGMGFDGVAGENLIRVYMSGKDLLALCEMDLMLNSSDYQSQFHFGRMRYEYSANRPYSNQVIDVYTEEADGYYIAATDDRMYPVITTVKVLDSIPAMIEACGGDIECNIYDENGKVLTDYELMALRNEDGAAIKQWSAIAEYAKHFDRGTDGISVLPDTYKTARKQRIRSSSLNFLKLFKHAGSATFAYYTKMIAIPVAVIAGLYVLVWILNLKKRKDSDD